MEELPNLAVAPGLDLFWPYWAAAPNLRCHGPLGLSHEWFLVTGNWEILAFTEGTYLHTSAKM